MQLLVGGNSLLELLLAYIAPRANCIGDNFNIEFCHIANSWPEHSKEKEEQTIG